ncbi:MAG: hypothetical protein ACLFP1_06255 [Candidatus Goldiibacteriota bacterium]
MKKRILAVLLILCFSVSAFARLDVVIDEAILEPKDPILGTVLAIGPGLLVHGWGHFYAEDYKMGLSLFTIELASLGAIGWGAYQYNNAETWTNVGGNADEVRRGAQITMAAGFLFFAATYIADIALAGQAAEQYNKEHNLEFKVNQEAYAPYLMYSYKY